MVEIHLRQLRVAHQIAIAFAGRPAAFVDGPHDESPPSYVSGTATWISRLISSGTSGTNNALRPRFIGRYPVGAPGEAFRQGDPTTG
jgi:hypothetical protein